ncbi:high choriolytic enzyme 1-like [Perca flavescens]|uniref:high choriolytic enzyme 1-like n=1 Tax=Perca flavescens TaxID=8167 RepID=UPI00106ED607|nr:high choriolytic enzyme 1-like [Perca flavescens]
MSPSASLLLLLLGLSQALPLPDTVDITTRILTSNKGSDEFLLEGDLLVPMTRNALICPNQNCFWKKNSSGLVLVPFTVSSDFTSSEKQLIVSALQGFHSTTCIRFVPRTNETDYVSVENQSGCFSYVGKSGGAQLLSLQRPGCLYYGTIQHEFNHALGFWHEQSRSDRDNYVTINWTNIDPQQVYNFNKQVTNNQNTPYDYSSIMEYARTAFSINGQDTIDPIPDSHVPIGQSQSLSAWDIIRINKLYSC